MIKNLRPQVLELGSWKWKVVWNVDGYVFV